ncbi:MAG: hypothetical protein WCY29_08840 [Novosphingobium sp.]
MATAKPIASTTPRRRWAFRLGLLLALAAAGVLAWFWGPLYAHAVTGASYGARVGCACRYVEGRPLGDCRKDFVPGMALVRLNEDEEARSVSASFPLLASQTATFREGRGCVLEKWDG